MTSDFVPVARLPYSVNALGQVRSERSGALLVHDRLGRVTLVDGKKKTLCYPGELLMTAGLMPVPGTAPECPMEPSPEQAAIVAALETSRDRQRRLNGHLMALNDKLRERVTELEMEMAANTKQARRGRPAKVDLWPDDMEMGE